MFNNPHHYLRQKLTHLESLEIEGKNGMFTEFLKEKGIEENGSSWAIDHSSINWQKVEKHFQFLFGFEGNELEIEKWLKRSEIIKYTFLLTWLDWNDPVVRIATNDFINNWEDFYHAGGGEGLILLTEDGKLFLEFTDDWKYHLHSNFEIKPNTEVILKR